MRYLPVIISLIVFQAVSLDKCATAITLQTNPISDKDGFSSSTQLVGTFYYGWYYGKAHEYRGWNVDNHNPPYTWASNYIPDMWQGLNAFDPANLYASDDQQILSKQLELMKQAGIQFGISSWMGIGSITDKTFSKIVTDVMPSRNNPYPSFKWVILYELEGYSDPPLENLMNDLNYIKEKYTTSPYYLKIDGKPVIFVYNAMHVGSNTSNDLERWSMARQSSEFYVVMKVDPLQNGSDPNSMDGWYEYNPTKRFEQEQGFSAFISPGFWKYHELPELPRNVTDFEMAVQKLASVNVHFKLIQTWNEWFEGTGIEPAMEVIHDDTHGFLPQNASYGNTYISILGKYFVR